MYIAASTRGHATRWPPISGGGPAFPGIYDVVVIARERGACFLLTSCFVGRSGKPQVTPIVASISPTNWRIKIATRQFVNLVSALKLSFLKKCDRRQGDLSAA
jgi:hypothetical protein